MLNKMKDVLSEIREDLQDESLGYQIMAFFIMLMVGTTIIATGYLIIRITYDFPKILLPIEIGLVVLWNLYRQFLKGNL